MPPQVLVTRPKREAAHWVEQLRARGVPAQALPLIAIHPCRTPAAQAALAQAHQALHQGAYHAVMFVSGNAVYSFFEQKNGSPPIHQAFTATKTRAWSPGPATARVLALCGVSAVLIDGPAADAAQFDSESLWQAVAGQIQPGQRVLIVRGASAEQATPTQGQGRDWLREQITAAGGQVDLVAAYERGAPEWSPTQNAQARQAAHDGSLWLLSSSEALHHLRQLLPDQHWGDAQALATHPRIADAARAAGFGHVRTCRPTLADVVASIESGA